MERDGPPRIVQGKSAITQSRGTFRVDSVEGTLTVTGNENTIFIGEVRGIVTVLGLNNNIQIQTQDPRARVSVAPGNFAHVESHRSLASRPPENCISRPLTYPVPVQAGGSGPHYQDRVTSNLRQFTSHETVHQQPRQSSGFVQIARWVQNFFRGGRHTSQQQQPQPQPQPRVLVEILDPLRGNSYSYYPDLNLEAAQLEVPQPRLGTVNEDYVFARYGREVRIEKTRRRPNLPNKECPVCQDTIEMAGDQSCHTDCYHWFHVTCLTPWLRENDACPVCKKRVEKLYRPLL